MKVRIIILIVVALCSASTLLVGVAIWSLPPQYQPEIVYNLKFGDRYPASRRAGDGTLTDFGPRAGIDRYVVDLGDLTDACEIDKTYLVSDLPAEDLTVGFLVSGSTGAGKLLFEQPNIGTAHLEVTTEGGDPLVLEQGPLSDWIWSGPLHLDDRAFVYYYRYDRQQATSGSDREHGSTSFTPSPTESYRIRVRATWKPETLEQYKIRLLVMGGGWQS